jgi:hypothetical protein
VSDRDAVLSLANKVKDEVGDVSILVNNAGIMHCHPLLRHSPQEIRNTYDINVLAHFWVSLSGIYSSTVTPVLKVAKKRRLIWSCVLSVRPSGVFLSVRPSGVFLSFRPSGVFLSVRPSGVFLSFRPSARVEKFALPPPSPGHIFVKFCIEDFNQTLSKRNLKFDKLTHKYQALNMQTPVRLE